MSKRRKRRMRLAGAYPEAVKYWIEPELRFSAWRNDLDERHEAVIVVQTPSQAKAIIAETQAILNYWKSCL